MSLIIAALFVLAYSANVVIGATSGSPFLGDVGEMLLLLGASVSFVVAILKREAAEPKKVLD